jgi:Haem degrading protein HbpS-like
VDAAANDGIRLDGSVAFSDRAVGFLSRPFFPDDIEDTEHGPFSVSIEQFSPFNTGLQIDLIAGGLATILTNTKLEDLPTLSGKCTPLGPELGNGIQIFAGSVPLYKNGQLVGALGISGDGIDQDDLIAAMGSAGFEAPANIRSDRVFVRDVRLPYVKFPRHPNL